MGFCTIWFAIMGARLVYIASGSQEDGEHRDELIKQMTVLRRRHLVEDWHEGLLLPGQPRQEAIAERLREADIVLPLISPDFLAESEAYIKDFEQTITRHHTRSARIIPILIRPTYTAGSVFDDFQYLPQNRQPVSTWKNQDQAWVEIVRGIRQAVDDLARGPTPPRRQEEGHSAHVSPTVVSAREAVLSGARSKWIAIGGVGVLAAGIFIVYVLSRHGVDKAPHVSPRVAPSLAATTHRPALILVQPGTFIMGCSASDTSCAPNETRHRVTLTRSFAIFETEVTQSQFHSLMGIDLVRGRTSWGGRCDELGVGADLPVPCTTFLDAILYANRLSMEERLAPC